jgi:hypothetical protein
MNTTPHFIKDLKSNEVFVFGSNVEGKHIGGAANQAMEWGAIWGQGVGLHGQTFAIPTMFDHYSSIQPYIEDFINFAKEHPNLKFFVTRIGCGIAGFSDKEIAPMFIAVKDEDIQNIYLPDSFWNVLNKVSKDS